MTSMLVVNGASSMDKGGGSVKRDENTQGFYPHVDICPKFGDIV